MIQPLRVVHRRSFIVLAFALPTMLVVGLAARRPKSLPDADSPKAPAFASVLKGSDSLWRRYSIRTEFHSSVNPNEIDVVLRPAQPVNEPDLLLYWTSTEPQGGALPDSSRLLGAVVPGKVFALTLDEGHAGYLVLYSGGHQAVVDTATAEKRP